MRDFFCNQFHLLGLDVKNKLKIERDVLSEFPNKSGISRLCGLLIIYIYIQTVPCLFERVEGILRGIEKLKA